MKKILSIFVALMVILAPISLSFGPETPNVCTIQERINYICEQGKDSPSSCSAEYENSQYASELDQLIFLRSEYGGDSLLDPLNYKGQAYCGKEPKNDCTVQGRINWICEQSPEDSENSCTAEYKNGYAQELDALIDLRDKYGGYAILDKLGYPGRTCKPQAKTQKNPDLSEETDGTDIKITDVDFDGNKLQLVIDKEKGTISGCKKDGIKINCLENVEAIGGNLESEEAIIPNGAAFSELIIGDGTANQLYSPYSTPTISISASGQPGTESAIIVWLVDKKTYPMFPLKIYNINFGAEGTAIVDDHLSILMDEGKYHVLAEIWQDGKKRAEKYYESTGVRGNIYVLENLDVSDKSTPSQEEVAYNLKTFLETRQKFKRESPEYISAFKNFMQSYIKASFPYEEQNEALIILEGQNIDALSQNAETIFRLKQAFQHQTQLMKRPVQCMNRISILHSH